MRILKWWLLVMFLVGMLLYGCGNTTLAHTATPVKSDTPGTTTTPESTLTLLPTDTSTPTLLPTDTPTPTSLPLLSLGDRLEAPEGGFSVRVVDGTLFEGRRTSMTFVDKEESFWIYLVGLPYFSYSGEVETELDGFLDQFEQYGEGTIERGDLYQIDFNGYEGTAADLTGSILYPSIDGKVVLITSSAERYFLGIVLSDANSDLEINGLRVFTTLLSSAEFFDPPVFVESDCEISKDETYGYVMQNPIEVGGSFFDGPKRERLFLDSLSGPNGEVVFYERTGSTSYEDLILDIYMVKYGMEESTLYIDMYNYEPPMAPVNFSCWTPIPLEKPEE